MEWDSMEQSPYLTWYSGIGWTGGIWGGMGFHGTVPLSYMVWWDRTDRWDLGWLCSVYMGFHGTVPLSYMGQWDRMDR